MIRNIFNPGNYSHKLNVVLLLLRLAAGVFMLTHGMGKFFKLFGDEPIKFADPMGIGVTTSLVLTVFAEVFCSAFLILGMATRLAAIPLFITMFVVVFIVKANKEFGDMELPLLYLVLYLAIAITGAGKYSLDYFIYRRIAPN